MTCGPSGISLDLAGGWGRGGRRSGEPGMAEAADPAAGPPDLARGRTEATGKAAATADEARLAGQLTKDGEEVGVDAGRRGAGGAAMRRLGGAGVAGQRGAATMDARSGEGGLRRVPGWRRGWTRRDAGTESRGAAGAAGRLGRRERGCAGASGTGSPARPGASLAWACGGWRLRGSHAAGQEWRRARLAAAPANGDAPLGDYEVAAALGGDGGDKWRVGAGWHGKQGDLMAGG